MRVLIVAWRDIDHPDAGGSEVVMDELAKGLLARGHQVALVCGGEHGEHEYPVVRNGGRGTQYLTAPLACRRFADADVLVEVVNGMPFLSNLWWRGPRIHFVHHVHADQWFQHFHGAVAAVGKAIETEVFPRLARGDLVTTVSPSTRDELTAIGVPAADVRVLELGVGDELRVEAPHESDEPLFVACGRLSPNKQYGLLLDLWDEVRADVGGRLVILGDGIERDELTRRLPPGAELPGFVDHATKVRLLTDAWLFVHVARQEGWGLVLLEAAAAGTPSLVLDAPGVRDAVIDGESGVLARDPDHFAKAWIELAHDGDLRRSLAAGARARADRFTWDRTVEQFEAVLVEAVARRSGRSR